MTEIRPATQEHFERMKGAPAPKTARAFAAVRGEAVLGLMGVYRDGASKVLFGGFTDELRGDKRSFIRLIRAVRPLIRGHVQALADPEVAGSDVLLKHMGFEPFEGGIYQWHG